MKPEQAFNYAKHVQGWTRREELEWLFKSAEAISPENGLWVEVGSWKGRSAIATALGLATRCTFCLVESFTGSQDSPGTHAETKFPADWLKEHLKLAIALIKALRPDLNILTYFMPSVAATEFFDDESVDGVFIDGAHNEKAVLADLKAWLPKVKVGGFMCGHDRGHPGVRAALKKTFKRWDSGPGAIWYRRKKK